MRTADHKQVLIVDDEPSVRAAVRAALSYYLPEYSYNVASNGQEAINLVASTHPGLILMDLQMPVMDGVQAFLEIKNTCLMKGWEMPAILFFTAYAPSDSVRILIASAPEHGMLQKPVTNQVLITEVKKRLQRSHT